MNSPSARPLALCRKSSRAGARLARPSARRLALTVEGASMGGIILCGPFGVPAILDNRAELGQAIGQLSAVQQGISVLIDRASRTADVRVLREANVGLRHHL